MCVGVCTRDIHTCTTGVHTVQHTSVGGEKKKKTFNWNERSIYHNIGDHWRHKFKFVFVSYTHSRLCGLPLGCNHGRCRFMCTFPQCTSRQPFLFPKSLYHCNAQFAVAFSVAFWLHFSTMQFQKQTSLLWFSRNYATVDPTICNRQLTSWLAG